MHWIKWPENCECCGSDTLYVYTHGYCGNCLSCAEIDEEDACGWFWCGDRVVCIHCEYSGYLDADNDGYIELIKEA